jgi:hypothetical protein
MYSAETDEGLAFIASVSIPSGTGHVFSSTRGETRVISKVSDAP